jgi:hypothetical protein
MVGKEDSERVENMEAVAEMEARAMVVAQPVVVDAVVLELVMAVVAIPEWPGPRVVVLMEGMAAAEQVKEMVAVVLMVRPITEGNAGPCPMQGREERLLAPNRARPVRGRLSPFLVDPLIEHTAHGTQSAHIRVYCTAFAELAPQLHSSTVPVRKGHIATYKHSYPAGSPR